MGLDAHVHCSCVREGRASTHPFPDRLSFDETGEPVLAGDPSTEEWDIHDKWYAQSCEHSGFLASARLGNIRMIAHVRELVRHLQANPGPRFPILLTQVVYNGTHCGDWIPIEKASELLHEVDTILHSKDLLTDSERRFFSSMRSLCMASIECGNPIVF
jgi:hypothetical protein